MKPFSRLTVDSEKLDWNFYLEFPTGDDFVSKRFPIDPTTALEFNEEMLPHFASIPGFEERRLAEKCTEPFFLIPETKAKR